MRLLLISVLIFSVSAFTQEESSREPAPGVTELTVIKVKANYLGDYMDGIGNLSVVEKGKYPGGCLGFPQFGIKGKGRINVDVRTGDFLVMDVHQWHCNTKIEPKSDDYTRLSIVAYLRDKMINCKGRPLQ